MACTSFYATSLDCVYNRDIFIPRDMDLPIRIQSTEGSPPSEFNYSIVDVTMEIFATEYSTTPLVTIGNAEWSRSASAGSPVNDIIETIILWSVTGAVPTGMNNYYRIYYTDAGGVKRPIMEGIYHKRLDI